jgi:5'-deoxynucleotidase YfbR-like HD superfamily hydrolase
MAMKEATEKAIDDILPKQLKQANADYRRYEQLKDAFGNRIVDADGNLKDSAETFISNLGNLNKGELRAKVKAFEDITGIDLVDEIQVMKDAQKLSPLFAETGSRTQDILRALIVGGIGGGTLGPVGTSAGLAVSSPRVIGKIATTIGKAKGLLGRSLGGMK